MVVGSMPIPKAPNGLQIAVFDLVVQPTAGAPVLARLTVSAVHGEVPLVVVAPLGTDVHGVLAAVEAQVIVQGDRCQVLLVGTRGAVPLAIMVKPSFSMP